MWGRIVVVGFAIKVNVTEHINIFYWIRGALTFIAVTLQPSVAQRKWKKDKGGNSVWWWLQFSTCQNKLTKCLWRKKTDIVRWERDRKRQTQIENDKLGTFKKWANPGPFYHLYLVLLNKQHFNFYNKYVKKCPSSIRYWDSNTQPIEHETPPITTRPGLPP